MAIKKDERLLGPLRALWNVGAVRELTDGQLLERFATGGGEPAELAFAALIERHGPMVLRVCRGVLTDPHEAQDAFQATFLVLLRKARNLWVRESIGPWLYGVAFRTASCARSAAARRRFHEQRAPGQAGSVASAVDADVRRALYEEIDRLPERYRDPLVLCDLEGCTYAQAARQLGSPIGTIQSRLSRGRDRLRDRLIRRGLAPQTGLLAAAPVVSGSEFPVPPALVELTSGAVVHFVTTRSIHPGPVGTLVRGVLTSMVISRASLLVPAAVLVVATALGLSALAQKENSGGPDARPAERRGNGLPHIVVKPGKLEVAVVERGTVEPEREENVSVRVPGVRAIVSILPEATRVKKGQLVCELDASPLRERLAELAAAGEDGEENKEAVSLRQQVASCKLYAPADGSVVHANDPSRFDGRRQIMVGANVRERQIIFRLIDLDGPMQLNTRVRAADVDRIKTGMNARLRVDHNARETLIGTVKQKAPLPDPKHFFDDPRLDFYTVKVSINTRPPWLRHGMTAEVEILVSELDNVLCVPITAVHHEDGRDFVAVKQSGGEIDWRAVTLGKHNDDFVEIRSGIQSGQLVILDPRAVKTRKNQL